MRKLSCKIKLRFGLSIKFLLVLLNDSVLRAVGGEKADVVDLRPASLSIALTAASLAKGVAKYGCFNRCHLY